MQCKHYAHGGRAVSTVGDFREALIRNSCHRYLLITSTTITENIRKTFEAFNNSARFPGERADFWTCADIMKIVRQKPRLRELYFEPPPITYRRALPADQTIEALLESHEFGTALVNRHSVIVSTNSRFRELFPNAREGQHCWLNYHSFSHAGPCRCCPSSTAFQRKKEVVAVAWSPIGPKGTLKYVEVRAVPIVDTHREVMGAVEVVHDIHSEMAIDTLRRKVSAAKEPGEILRSALLSMAQIFAVEKCAVYQLTDDNRLTGLEAFRLDKSAVRRQRKKAGIVFIREDGKSGDAPELPAIHRRCKVPLLRSARAVLPALPSPDSSDLAIATLPSRPQRGAELSHPFFQSLAHWMAIYFGREHPWQVFFLLGNNVPFDTAAPDVREFIQHGMELTSLALLRSRISQQSKAGGRLNAPRKEQDTQQAPNKRMHARRRQHRG